MHDDHDVIHNVPSHDAVCRALIDYARRHGPRYGLALLQRHKGGKPGELPEARYEALIREARSAIKH